MESSVSGNESLKAIFGYDPFTTEDQGSFPLPVAKFAKLEEFKRKIDEEAKLEPGNITLQELQDGQQHHRLLPPILIGRAPENHLCIKEEQAVSMRHCQIQYVNSEYLLINESVNGTFLKVRQSFALEESMIFSIGNLSLKVKEITKVKPWNGFRIVFEDESIEKMFKPETSRLSCEVLGEKVAYIGTDKNACAIYIDVANYSDSFVQPKHARLMCFADKLWLDSPTGVDPQYLYLRLQKGDVRLSKHVLRKNDEFVIYPKKYRFLPPITENMNVKCWVCKKNDANCTNFDCAHKTFCDQCGAQGNVSAQNLIACPSCTAPVKKVVKTYEVGAN